MAYGKKEENKKDLNYKNNKKNASKADLILETDLTILEKLSKLSDELIRTNERISALSKPIAGNGNVGGPDVQNSIQAEIDSVKQEIKYLAAQNESIYLTVQQQLQNLTAAIGGAPVAPLSFASPESVPAPRAEIDYDKLAAKIAEMLPVQEYISPDYIACKVAEQIVVPESHASAQAAPAGEPRSVSRVPVDLQLDEEDLADRIALKVGGIKADDFDILVDDDGCSSISKAIVSGLNYDLISSAIAEKLRVTLEYLADRETDYEEVASIIGDKIQVAGINEDAIAEKAANVLSTYLPEIDADDIADKIAAQLISVMPTATEVDGEAISKTVADKLIEAGENRDYEIVLDDEGVEKITGQVTGELNKTTGERFDKIEKDIADIKAMLASGVIREVAASSAASDESYVAEESLVTVSDLVEGEITEDVAGQYGEISKLVEELDEEPEDAGPEDDYEAPALAVEDGKSQGGVDFENMMKYNRSFIARIIQSTDEQKGYYGSVKTALLSYAKVNSNVAWGAERFNKGRETIARFKIRGKTLCLYLALDPAEYPYSVYHQVDVSDNKSLHGTPLMVKIKSPRGAKKAIRLIDDMLEKRGAVKRNRVIERDYAAMYPYETIEELIEDGLVKNVEKNK